MKKRWLATWGEMGGLPPLMAVALLIANDHWGKATFHNAWTGKLSDVAICFLLPLLCATVWGLVMGGRLRARLIGGAIFSAALFTLLELSDPAGAIFVGFMARLGRHAVLTRDLSDLGALVMIPVAVTYALWRERRRLRQPRTLPGARVQRLGLAGLLTTAMGTLALMADSPPPLCDELSLPVVFRADPGCGEGGLFVVEAEEDNGFMHINNRPALGLPPDSNYSNNARYVAGHCPFRLAEGGWEIRVSACQTEAGAGDPYCAGYARTCAAKLEGAGLWFVCRRADPGTDSGANPNPELCRSRLTVVP